MVRVLSAIISLLLAVPALHAGLAQDAGVVHIPKGSLPPGDFLVAVYSEDLESDPIRPSTFAAPPPGQLVGSGCLSVVRFESGSGASELTQPGKLVFGCGGLPDEAVVYGWVDGLWQKLPSWRTPGGRIAVDFTDLTTYAILLESSRPTDPGRI